MSKEEYGRLLATASVDVGDGSEARVERIFVNHLQQTEIRFSWWKGGRFMPRPLDIPEKDVLALFAAGISAGVFTDRFLLELSRLLLVHPLSEKSVAEHE